MGLASSQARNLLLVARKSDIEYRGQCINQRRLMLSYHLEEMARIYSNKLSDRQITMESGIFAGDQLSISSLLSNGIQQYLVATKDGTIVGATNTNGSWTAIEEGTDGYVDSDLLEQGLRTGGFHLVEVEDVTVAGTGGKQNVDENGELTGSVDWRTLPIIDDKLNDDNDEAATAEYEYQSQLIHAEDQRLEVELRNLDTQHKAIETEIEAVKKVIDKNIEMSFKTFA